MSFCFPLLCTIFLILFLFLRLPLYVRALSHAQNSPLCLVFSFRSHPPYSRFISFFCHPSLRRTRTDTCTTHVSTSLSLSLFLSLSLSLPLSIFISPLLSPTVPCPYDEECRQRSNRSLAFARTASPFFTLLPSASPLLLFLHHLLLHFLRRLLPQPSFSTTLFTLPSDLLYHIRHQHYTRALISSVGNSAFLAISLLPCHPLTPSPTLSPPTLSPPRALLRFLRLSIPTRPTHRIVYALRSSTRLGYGCLISLCRT